MPGNTSSESSRENPEPLKWVKPPTSNQEEQNPKNPKDSKKKEQRFWKNPDKVELEGNKIL